MNKQQLAAKIWESANKMRSKIEANEYKDYILGFIFYRFLSEQEERFLTGKRMRIPAAELAIATEENAAIRKRTQKALGYFVGYPYLFSTWLHEGSDFDVAEVRDALSAFARLIDPDRKNVFGGIFDTLATGLSKLGDSAAAQTKSILGLLHLIKDIPMDTRQDYDVLGFIYEYLIANFAANAGKKAGEFYTPHEVSVLMSEIVADALRGRTELAIYDPTSGSGSLLLNLGRAAAKYLANPDGIRYYAQELKENTYNLTRMNLVMRGIAPNQIMTRNADTLESDWPMGGEDGTSEFEPLRVDAVVSNPPYSQHWDPAGKESDPRYAAYGLAPRGKADYAFLLHDLFHVKDDGLMTIVLPHGVLFRGGEEGTIREKLIEQGRIDAIIGLPANIFYGTGIPTIIMVLRPRRTATDVLIIDASKGYEKAGTQNRLRASDIRRIADTVKERRTIPGFSRAVPRDEIRANGYNLNIPRYVDSSEPPESWDLYATLVGGIPQRELDAFAAEWAAFPGLRDALFTAKNEAYVLPSVSDLAIATRAHPAVRAFAARFAASFDGFDDHLHHALVDDPVHIDLARMEDTITEDIFHRLEGLPLVDPYAAYQTFHDSWVTTENDIEILQTEGWDAVRQVDPDIVTKKKNGKDVEVTAGWLGHVLPFGLVQRQLLADDLAAIEAEQQALDDALADEKAQLDELSEEDKAKAFVNEDGTAFVWAEVKAALKAKEEDPATLAVLKCAQKANEVEKRCKKALKERNAALEKKTKETIEQLDDATAKALLHEKWIATITRGIAALPEALIESFTTKLAHLAEKYATTLADTDAALKEAETALGAMLPELRGNAYDMQAVEELAKLLGRE